MDANSYNAANPNADAVPNAPIPGADDNQRVLGRQLPSGAIRGNQVIAGTLVIIDPTTKLNRILVGLLPDGTYGEVISKTGIDVYTVF